MGSLWIGARGRWLDKDCSATAQAGIDGKLEAAGFGGPYELALLPPFFFAHSGDVSGLQGSWIHRQEVGLVQQASAWARNHRRNFDSQALSVRRPFAEVDRRHHRSVVVEE